MFFILLYKLWSTKQRLRVHIAHFGFDVAHRFYASFVVVQTNIAKKSIGRHRRCHRRLHRMEPSWKHVSVNVRISHLYGDVDKQFYRDLYSCCNEHATRLLLRIVRSHQCDRVCRTIVRRYRERYVEK